MQGAKLAAAVAATLMLLAAPMSVMPLAHADDTIEDAVDAHGTLVCEWLSKGLTGDPANDSSAMFDIAGVSWASRRD